MEAIVVCPHCSGDVAVGDDLSGAAAACPLCAGQFTVPVSLFPAVPPQPAPSVVARPRVVARQQRRPVPAPPESHGPTKITFGVLGLLFFGIIFLVDAPDHRRIAQLEKQLQEEQALGDRFSRISRLNSTVAEYLPSKDRGQAYRNSDSAWQGYDQSYARSERIATEIGKARSTSRGLWGFGLFGSLLWLLSGIFRPHSKQLI